MTRLRYVFSFILLLLAFQHVQAQTDSDQHPTARQDQAELTLDELRTFTEVFNQLRSHFVEPVGDRALLEAAMRGMVATLDPHSAYLSPAEFEALNDASHGRYVGIGVRLKTDEHSIVIDEVFPGGPADRSGLGSGDIVIAVDGHPVSNGPAQESISRLGGEPGTDFELTVLAADGKETRHRLTREYVMTETHEFQWLDNAWAYFRLQQFYSESATRLHEAIDAIIDDGHPIHGIIIDLRNNPGGILKPAVDIADGFLGAGRIVTTSGRTSAMEMSFDARETQWLADVPLVILVDKGSASASEVLAGALQDHGRALVLGERTFGKGSVQSVLPLRNGGGIKLTTAMYYTPSGRSIQANGIVPDVKVDLSGKVDDRIRESDLEGHLRETEPHAGTPGVPANEPPDVDLDDVLRVLRDAELIGEPAGQ